MKRLENIIRFEYLGHEWLGRMVQNESNTKIIPRVTTNGPPWPSKECYRGAIVKFKELLNA